MSDVVNLPRRRTGRVAPPSLRPAPLTEPQVTDLARLLKPQTIKPENDR